MNDTGKVERRSTAVQIRAVEAEEADVIQGVKFCRV